MFACRASAQRLTGVMVDTSAQSKAIAQPTDGRLLEMALVS